jgi:hypothetical protein
VHSSIPDHHPPSGSARVSQRSSRQLRIDFPPFSPSVRPAETVAAFKAAIFPISGEENRESFQASTVFNFQFF